MLAGRQAPRLYPHYSLQQAASFSQVEQVAMSVLILITTIVERSHGIAEYLIPRAGSTPDPYQPAHLPKSLG